jgi:hypothetical protein
MANYSADQLMNDFMTSLAPDEATQIPSTDSFEWVGDEDKENIPPTLPQKKVEQTPGKPRKLKVKMPTNGQTAEDNQKDTKKKIQFSVKRPVQEAEEDQVEDCNIMNVNIYDNVFLQEPRRKRVDREVPITSFPPRCHHHKKTQTLEDMIEPVPAIVLAVHTCSCKK